jgi:hypothetical protein
MERYFRSESMMNRSKVRAKSSAKLHMNDDNSDISPDFIFVKAYPRWQNSLGVMKSVLERITQLILLS